MWYINLFSYCCKSLFLPWLRRIIVIFQTRQPVFVQLLQGAFRLSHCSWLTGTQKYHVENCIKTLSDIGKVEQVNSKHHCLSLSSIKKCMYDNIMYDFFFFFFLCTNEYHPITLNVDQQNSFLERKNTIRQHI